MRPCGHSFHPATSIAWSAGASLVVGDEQLNNYFYGVQAPFATAARPAYNAQAGLIATRLSLSASTRLGKDWRLFGFARVDTVAGAANENSPLVRKTTGTTMGLGIAYTWQRSTQRAIE